MTKTCYWWIYTKVCWKDANWLWSECQLVNDIIIQLNSGVDANTLIQPWIIQPWSSNKLDIEKKKRLIKLICKIKGIIYEEEKMVKDMKISVEDIKLVVKEVSGIDLDFKL